MDKLRRDKVMDALHRKGLTLVDMADRAQISTTHASRLMNHGVKNPVKSRKGRDFFAEVARATGYSVHYLAPNLFRRGDARKNH